MGKTKEQMDGEAVTARKALIAEASFRNRVEKIRQAREAIKTNENLRGYLSSQSHPFDNKLPTSTNERSLLTYYEWGLSKARHYKQYEIAKDVLKLPIAHYRKHHS